jgi:hypothetical protein
MVDFWLYIDLPLIAVSAKKIIPFAPLAIHILSRGCCVTGKIRRK